MDYDVSVLLNEYWFNYRRRDWFNAGRTLIRYNATFGDRVVYDPKGIHNLLIRNLPISKQTGFRYIAEYVDTKAIYKMDEYSCQTQPALSIKGEPMPGMVFKGPKFILEGEELEKSKKIKEERDENVKLRFKKPKKKEKTVKDNEKEMEKILKEMQQLRTDLFSGFDALRSDVSDEMKSVRAMVKTLQVHLNITDPAEVTAFVQKFHLIKGSL